MMHTVVLLRSQVCRQDGGKWQFLPILSCGAFNQQFDVYDSDLKQFTQREVSSKNPANAKYSGTQGSAEIAKNHKKAKNI